MAAFAPTPKGRGRGYIDGQVWPQQHGIVRHSKKPNAVVETRAKEEMVKIILGVSTKAATSSPRKAWKAARQRISVLCTGKRET